jgi:hypothetical protein
VYRSKNLCSHNDKTPSNACTLPPVRIFCARVHLDCTIALSAFTTVVPWGVKKFFLELRNIHKYSYFYYKGYNIDRINPMALDGIHVI